MLVSATSPIVNFYMYNFVLNHFLIDILFLSCRPGLRLINKSYLCFRLVCANGKLKQQMCTYPISAVMLIKKLIKRLFDDLRFVIVGLPSLSSFIPS